MGFLRSRGIVYKPMDEVDLGPNSDEVYISPIVKAPRMAGFLVKLFAWLVEFKIIGLIITYFLKKDNLIHKLVSFAEMEETPVFVPLHHFEDAELSKHEVVSIKSNQSPCNRVQQGVECLSPNSEIEHSFRHWTIMDYTKAYKSAAITPTKVAEQFLREVEKSSNPKYNMSFFISYDAHDILQQAAESTLRYEKGEQLSVLDGVPIAIKDEIDCAPYPTTGGTTWLHKYRPCKRDACCVERLRSCGALLVGKTNMQELGAGLTGINPHYGATRNPYDTSRISGGSSSGSAAVVCSGLCPVALGVDGGGSVRMPAALCGIVGLKPTFGRIPHDGVIPLNWTLGTVGILSGTVEDALVTYAAIAGEFVSSTFTALQPEVKLPLLKPKEITGDIKMAKYGKWFNDCNAEVQLCCSKTIDKLQTSYGWQMMEVTVPDIETMRLAHFVTIGSECIASLDRILQKVNRELHFFNKILSKADVIVVPAAGVTATAIHDDALMTGELNYVTGAALVRYQIAGNFLGLPAVTVPIGFDESGLPIGLQFIGKPWSEATLLYIAYAVQALCRSDYRKPTIYYNMFDTA